MAKKKKRKYRKKGEREKLTIKLDELVKQILRLREDSICEKCDKYVEGPDAHTSHVVAKDNGASHRRFDLMNVSLLCKRCHLYWWHKSPLDASDWYKDKFPNRYEYLSKYRGGKPAKISTGEMEELVEEYTEKLKELNNGG
jgi:5-methylcytosine-specific restriction endonuclease McrA